MTQTNNNSQEYRLEITVRKTKIMAISREDQKLTVNINGDASEQLTYLGHMITDDRKCEQEISRKLEWPNAYSTKGKIIFTLKCTTPEWQLRVIIYCVCSKQL